MFVLNDFIIGGVQRLYLELFTHLDQSMYELHLITLIEFPKRANLYDSIPAHVHVHRLTIDGFRDVRGWWYLYKRFAVIKPDLVLTTLYFSNTLVRTIGLLFKFPILAAEQNTNTWKSTAQIVVDRVLSYRSACIIAASKTVKEFSAKQAGISPVRFTVIHNSIDSARMNEEATHIARSAVLSEFGFGEHDRIVVNVARLVPQKNHAMLIEGFARFQKSHPNYKLLILGEGSLHASLTALIAEHGMQESIVLAGAKQKVAPYVAAADFFVSTSFIEGFGIAHAEALALGIPLLSTKTAGPDEMIEEGVTGYFVDATIESIEEGLVRMAEHGVSASPEQLRASVARFDSVHIAKEYSDAFLRALSRRPQHAKPRIALMTYAMDNRPNKGTALYTRKLVERLRKDPTIECVLVHYEKVDDPLYENVEEIIMPKVRLPYGSRFVSQMLFYLEYRTAPFDCIHWFQPRLYPFFWLAPGRHLIATAHGGGDVLAPSKFIFSKSVFNFIFTHWSHTLDAVLAVSDAAKLEIAEAYHMPLERIAVTYNGGGEDIVVPDADASAEIIASYGITRPYLLDVSRHVPHKNIPTLIDAYDIFRTKHSERTEQLVIVGSRSISYEENMKRIHESPHKEDCICIEFAPTDHLMALYRGASVFVFPSLNEGFGIPVIEAFSAGTPVITSNTTALPEIAGDGALLVDPSDAHAIADAMARLLVDTELRKQCIENGHRQAKKFTWDATAKETAEVYMRVLGQP